MANWMHISSNSYSLFPWVYNNTCVQPLSNLLLKWSLKQQAHHFSLLQFVSHETRHEIQFSKSLSIRIELSFTTRKWLWTSLPLSGTVRWKAYAWKVIFIFLWGYFDLYALIWYQSFVLLKKPFFLQKFNQVVIWDKIVLRGDHALLNYEGMNTKYYFFDDGMGLKYEEFIFVANVLIWQQNFILFKMLSVLKLSCWIK